MWKTCWVEPSINAPLDVFNHSLMALGCQEQAAVLNEMVSAHPCRAVWNDFHFQRHGKSLIAVVELSFMPLSLLPARHVWSWSWGRCGALQKREIYGGLYGEHLAGQQLMLRNGCVIYQVLKVCMGWDLLGIPDLVSSLSSSPHKAMQSTSQHAI